MGSYFGAGAIVHRTRTTQATGWGPCGRRWRRLAPGARPGQQAGHRQASASVKPDAPSWSGSSAGHRAPTGPGPGRAGQPAHSRTAIFLGAPHLARSGGKQPRAVRVHPGSRWVPRPRGDSWPRGPPTHCPERWRLASSSGRARLLRASCCVRACCGASLSPVTPATRATLLDSARYQAPRLQQPTDPPGAQGAGPGIVPTEGKLATLRGGWWQSCRGRELGMPGPVLAMMGRGLLLAGSASALNWINVC